MTTSLITLIIVLGLPAILMRVENKVKLIKWVSPIIICYLAGIIIANTNFLNPEDDFIRTITEISIGLAIPLLLFSANLKKWLGQAGKTLLSFGISVLGVLIASILAYLVFSDNIPEANKASGMMIGVYTGGTANLNAIGIALEAADEVLVLLNSADVIISGVYFIFLLTVAKPLLRLFLPAFKNSKKNGDSNYTFELNDLKGHSVKSNIWRILIGLGLALIVLGISAGVTILISGGMKESIVMLLITTLAIGCSFNVKVRNLRGTYRTAEYLLLVFAVAIGCLANLRELLNASSHLFLFCGFVIVVSIIIHFSLAAVFRIDADTVIITSTAAIYGPAFVGPVANALKNPRVIVSGITMGLLGYSLAYYVGMGVAKLLNIF